MNRKTFVSLIGLVLILCLGSSAVTYAVTISFSFSTIIEAGSMVSGYSYVIFVDGSTYYAKDGTSGAIGYSGTDASQITNNCIQTLGVTGIGGLISFESGDFLFTAPIIVDQVGIVLEGQGSGFNFVPSERAANTRLYTTEVDMSLVVVGSAIFRVNGFEIRDLFLEGGSTTWTSGASGIALGQTDIASITRVSVKGFQVGLHINGADAPRIIDSSFQWNRVGVLITNALYPRFIANEISDNVEEGMKIEGCLGGSAVSNTFSSNTIGLTIPSGNNVTYFMVGQNNFIGWTTSAIELYSANTQGCAYNIIANNVFISTHADASYGIKLDNNAYKNQVENNIVHVSAGTLTYGIRELGTSDYTMVIGTSVTGAGTVNILVSGANTTVNLCWNGTSWIS